MGNVDQRAAEILKRLPDGACMAAEVGVWDGRLSEALLRGHRSLVLLMVDRWHAVDPGHRYAVEGSRTLGQKSEAEYQAAKAMAQERVAFAGVRAQFFYGESVSEAQLVMDDSLDLGFLDGDHSRGGMMEDLVAWWPKVRLGGWIGGHDWEHPQQGDVAGAVRAWQHKYERWMPIEMGVDRVWFMKRRA